MTYSDFFVGFQWFYLLYFCGVTGVYIMLNMVAFATITRYRRNQVMSEESILYSGLEYPVTLLAPAYNEEATIVSSVRSLLQLTYPEYEVVVINDGSKDRTLEILIDCFELQVFPEAYRARLPTRPIKGIYYSTRYPKLRVIDKENGGKADALNAGINGARYPFFCGMDADSILQRDSLLRIVRPVQEDPHAVAVGGVVRLVNGCKVRDGHLVQIGLPRNLLALFQVVEYLRAFLFGRMGWQPMNAVLIISGAFGLFSKEVVIAVGGYRLDTVGEDMELVVRLHRLMRKQKRPYRVHFVPDPICWTEAPEDLRTLKNQRIRWQRGLAESLWSNRGLLFSRNGGAAGWLAFPFMLFFELFGPLIELLGLIVLVLAYYFDMINGDVVLAFSALAIGHALLLSTNALLLEELSYNLYKSYRDLLLLLFALIAENFGYRQLNSYWRLVGLLDWLFKRKGGWGKMRRRAKWRS